MNINQCNVIDFTTNSAWDPSRPGIDYFSVKRHKNIDLTREKYLLNSKHIKWNIYNDEPIEKFEYLAQNIRKFDIVHICVLNLNLRYLFEYLAKINPQKIIFYFHASIKFNYANYLTELKTSLIETLDTITKSEIYYIDELV